ncbi:putative phosphoglycerate mutase [Microbacterium terrae]|uniref:2,3-bisphosphoglycerate-dependent phosphoglycerate mutase n=1 Tax=Microbacterium terrae TaxID=69369 RepID=A0A0M2H1V9_9MICO|nr:histidine phosphatase family protein [Microbacterium terrae]KJL38058.1 2,3-bisphosphoglycerate-dependent phosphoglycerate mutase [Microbacterium terrae]MBP1077470.1 putative phosphoglycerate mutase [Microbacterium terrae]GLJ99076.1 phosphoglycerate mutase [Microbacterium terrae]
MTTLILVRHGETDWNRDRRIQGATDIPLNDTGRAQVRAAAATLRDRLGGAAITLAASDLLRAQETAEIIGAELGAGAPRLYPGLRERMYGEAEGMLVSEFFTTYGESWSPDVPGAETPAALRTRAVAAVVQAVRDHRAATAPENAVLVAVAHGGLIREVIGHASGDTLPAPGERIPNGSLHEFLVERDALRLLAYDAIAA